MECCLVADATTIAHADVLIDSIRSQHRDAGITVLAVSPHVRESLTNRQDVHVVGLDELGIEPCRLTRLRMVFEPGSWVTVFRPFLLRTVVVSADAPTVLLDPCCEVFGSLDPLIHAAA